MEYSSTSLLSPSRVSDPTKQGPDHTVVPFSFVDGLGSSAFPCDIIAGLSRTIAGLIVRFRSLKSWQLFPKTFKPHTATTGSIVTINTNISTLPFVNLLPTTSTMASIVSDEKKELEVPLLIFAFVKRNEIEKKHEEEGTTVTVCDFVLPSIALKPVRLLLIFF